MLIRPRIFKYSFRRPHRINPQNKPSRNHLSICLLSNSRINETVPIESRTDDTRKKSGKMTRDPSLAKSSDLPEASVEKRPRKSQKKLARDQKNMDKFFFKYADKESGIIEPKGIEALCSDLKVDHADIGILKLAWKMGAEKQGYFTQAEWQRGLEPLEVTCLTKLKKALRHLKSEVLEPDEMMDFYQFAYRFCLVEEGQKYLDIETTCSMIELVLGPIHTDEVDSLVEFLKIQTAYKRITMDQWMSFLHFFREFNFPDFGTYTTAEAWPLILDNFVVWMKAKGQE